MTYRILAPAVLLALAACGGEADKEESPGAAARYLDNISANETPADRAAIAADKRSTSPVSGTPAPELGQSPIYSREPVPPRR